MTFMEQLQRVPLLTTLVRTGRAWRANLTDLRLGIETGPDPEENSLQSRFNDHRKYEPMNYACVRVMLRALRIGPQDVVYDIGCGKGRLVCTAARLGVKKAIGFDLCPMLVKQAQWNAEALRGPKSPIEIRLADAATADYSGGTVYCLYHPFGEQTFLAMLAGIRRSLEAEPRTIRIGYAHPNFDYVLESSGWLRLRRCLQFRTFRHGIHVWESVPVHRLRANPPMVDDGVMIEQKDATMVGAGGMDVRANR